MTARRSAPWLLVVAVALVALVLRGPIVAVAPIIDAVREDLALSAGQAGILTSIPVLCFALATPLALLVIRRAGPDAAVTVTVIGVALGTIVRSIGDVGPAVAGTILIGVSITIGNVVLPVVIRRDVAPERVDLTTGVYTAALNIGSTITSLGTAPLALTLGWRGALLVWLALNALALAGWLVAVGPRAALRPTPRPSRADRAPAAPAPRIFRSATVLALALCFSSQAFSYYGVTAWLPSLLVDRNGFSIATAGASASVFQLAAVAGALGVPLLVRRLGPLGSIVLVGLLWCTVPAGLLLAPQLWALWCVLGGAAQGGGFTVVFVLVVRLSRSDAHASRLSATVQGIGYAVAATAPTVIGFAHDASGGWEAPLLTVLAATCSFLLFGTLAAARQRRA
ncbi:MFS transporter [Rathayibacter sp. AY1G1]|jgi:CP family cyanate transporter-like MFS transporter|uniref:MFS transporter n=1 Tax=unclassified Rathayibacter TaxID=2609250 RepID=UPI000CE8C2FB|nr:MULTISPECIES: MFS transporter [unclassified Rathayibacter]PPH12720.1 MFS transporter [Rathayibacter sp. AY1C1]PPH15371.1 MFS transporter [Rathayibacter sp. AY1G1]PPH44386.1 MFS transporter [Rathayibacter sp. AY1C9]PPH80673.1 MFS transporter [Rathayibacter sp. AY1D9]PPH96137.1 MFS transporter [Rathayibacter sp. AY1B7]